MPENKVQVIGRKNKLKKQFYDETPRAVGVIINYRGRGLLDDLVLGVYLLIVHV